MKKLIPKILFLLLLSSPLFIYCETGKYFNIVESTSDASKAIGKIKGEFRVYESTPSTTPGTTINGSTITAGVYYGKSGLTNIIDPECRISTGIIQNQLNSVALDTGTLKTDINNIGVATGTLRTDLTSVRNSTGTIQTQVNSIAVSTGIINDKFSNYIDTFTTQNAGNSGIKTFYSITQSSTDINFGFGSIDNYNRGNGFGYNNYLNYNSGNGFGQYNTNNYNYGNGFGQYNTNNYDYGNGFGNNNYSNYNYGNGFGQYNANNYDYGNGFGNNNYENYNYGNGFGYGNFNNREGGLGMGNNNSDCFNYGIGIGSNNHSANGRISIGHNITNTINNSIMFTQGYTLKISTIGIGQDNAKEITFTTHTNTQGYSSATSFYGDGTKLWFSTPTADNQAATRGYVDSVLPADFTYYFYKIDSDLGYYTMYSTPSLGAAQQIEFANATEGVIISSWITSVGYPRLNFLPAGNIDFHLYAFKGAPGSCRLFCELWKRTAGGVETVISTSSYSELLETTTTFLDLYASINDENLNLTDRLFVVVKAKVYSGSPDITLLLEDQFFAGVSIPVSHGMFLSRYGDIVEGDYYGNGYKIEFSTIGNVNSGLYGNGSNITNVKDIACRNSTGTIQTQLNDVASSTGTMQDRLIAVGIDTGTLAAASIDFACRISTGIIQNQLNLVAVSTGTLVKKSGDTMTGILNMGTNNITNAGTISGIGIQAMGSHVNASGNYSSALGDYAVASGLFSLALGPQTTSSGISSSSMGQNTTASGDYSTAIGYNATASGDYSTVIGGGVISGSPLVNNIPCSLMVGFNSQTPCFTVFKSSITTETVFISTMIVNGYSTFQSSISVIAKTNDTYVATFGTTTAIQIVVISTGCASSGSLDLATEVKEKIVDYIFTSSATSIQFTGLNGNVDEVYWITCRFIAGQANNYFSQTLNNDTNNNYGYTRLRGDGSSASSGASATETGFGFNAVTPTVGTTILVDGILYAKVGINANRQRTALFRIINVGNDIMEYGNYWNDQVSNITTMEFFGNVANGIGIDSHIIIYRKRK